MNISEIARLARMAHTSPRPAAELVDQAGDLGAAEPATRAWWLTVFPERAPRAAVVRALELRRS